jgi:hypothetical protein
MRLRSLLPLMLSLMLLATGCSVAQEQALQHRWLFVMRSLDSPKALADTLALLPRAQAAGCNAIVLSDGNLYDLERADASYRENLLTLQREAGRQGLDLIPCVMPIGYSGAILSVDPNLAEGLPVKDAVFVVHNGQAALRADPEEALPGGAFEEVDGDTFAGWDWQDNAGTSIFADHDTVHGGLTSVRMEHIPQGDPQWGHCRFNRTVTVHPFHQ